MESFFWVLLYICLTRCGPGGHRRQELSRGWPLDDPQCRQLAMAVWNYFDADKSVLTKEKRQLFLEPQRFEESILPLIHPYFKPLKSLILTWWNILVRGFNDTYTCRDKPLYGYLYRYPVIAFQNALQDAMSGLPHTMDPPEIQSMTAAEDKRRLEDLRIGGFLQPSRPVTPPNHQSSGTLDRDLSPSQKPRVDRIYSEEEIVLNTLASDPPAAKKKRVDS